MELDKIYTVTMVGTKSDPLDTRCWGWFPKLENAVRTVRWNQTDIFEIGYYKYAVIEESLPGVYGSCTQHSWWTMDPKADLATKLDNPPEEHKRAINLWQD